MVKLQQHTPDGVEDLLEEECLLKRKVESTVFSVFNSWGYNEVQTPTFEYYNTFLGIGGELKQEAMIKFFDSKGRILTLRPDLTTPIARMVATKYQDAALPLRLCYVGNAFRGGESFKGARQHEFTQAGIELIGVNSAQADAEVVAVTIKALLAAGLSDFLIELGQADFFKGLVIDANLSEDEIEALRLLVDSKDLLGISDTVRSMDMSERHRELFATLPTLYGDIDIVDKVSSLDLNERSQNALDNLKQVYEILEDQGLEKYISIDLGLIGAIDYYTGIIFKGVTHALGLPLCGGGRYDNLIGKFGEGKTATGIAIGINRLMSALYRQKGDISDLTADALVTYEPSGRKTAFLISEKLREQGLRVLTQVGNESVETGGVFHCINEDEIKVIDKVHGTEKTISLSVILGVEK